MASSDSSRGARCCLVQGALGCHGNLIDYEARNM